MTAGFALRSKLTGVAISALLWTWSPASGGTILTETDAKSLYDLGKQALDVGVEMHSFSNTPSETLYCITDLDTPLDKFYAAWRPVVALVRVATKMNEGADEQTVLRALKIEADNFVEKLGEARRGTHYIMGICAREALAVNEAQKLFARRPDEPA